jgi:hypothetical protein
MARLLHHCVSWLLSAVLLLTNGWPVAIRHAHDVGGNLYHHSHRTDVRASAIETAEYVGQVGGAVSGVTEHVHMLWLGWELTIVSPKGGGTNPCPSAAAVGILANLVERASAELDAAAMPLISMPVVAFDSPPTHLNATVRANSAGHVAALPLCDSARHLRSGVQLI